MKNKSLPFTNIDSLMQALNCSAAEAAAYVRANFAADKTEYVVCFALTPNHRVALVEKLRPEWQLGRLNGVGGKIESFEGWMEAARREFREEAGVDVPDGEPEALGEFRVTSGKSLTAFRLHGSVDLAAVVFGTFELEWPPRSGRIQEFPELDRAEWVELDRAGVLLTKGQRPILAALSVSGTD